MPAKSKKQFRFLQALAHGAKPHKGKGPSKSKAKEMLYGESPKGLPETKKTEDFPATPKIKRIERHLPPSGGRPSKTILTPPPKGGKSPKGVRGQLIRSEQEVIEELLKAYERRDDYTMIDPREFYGALQTVNKRVMEWVSKATKGMKVNESRQVNLPVEGALLKVRKLANDMYSGWLIDKAGDINHLYDRLTLPALASQIMSIYEVYDPDEKENKPSLRSLKQEIELLNGELKDVKSTSTHLDVEERIKTLIDSIDKLTDSNTKQIEAHDKLVSRTEAEINGVHDKLKRLQGLVSDEVQALRADPHSPEFNANGTLADKDLDVPNQIAVRRVGEPGMCSDCGSNPCKCYTHLTKPTIEVAPGGKITIFFKSDWNSLDKMNFLGTMKMVADKKRK